MRPCLFIGFRRVPYFSTEANSRIRRVCTDGRLWDLLTVPYPLTTPVGGVQPPLESAISLLCLLLLRGAVLCGELPALDDKRGRSTVSDTLQGKKHILLIFPTVIGRNGLPGCVPSMIFQRKIAFRWKSRG